MYRETNTSVKLLANVINKCQSLIIYLWATCAQSCQLTRPLTLLRGSLKRKKTKNNFYLYQALAICHHLTIGLFYLARHVLLSKQMFDCLVFKRTVDQPVLSISHGQQFYEPRWYKTGQEWSKYVGLSVSDMDAHNAA